MITTIGELRYGDIFIFNGEKYKSCKVIIRNGRGVVLCLNLETHKMKHFYLNTEVKVE